MKKTRIIILGGGISGLAAAYFLKKQHENIDIQVIEKNKRLGGCLLTKEQSGFFFEKGPRTFRSKECSALRNLAKELGLDDEIIEASADARYRYIYFKNVLECVPDSPFHLLKSPLTRTSIYALIREGFRSQGCDGDESIHQFITRRFDQSIADRLIDPFTTGVYSGNSKQLSVTECFPALKTWEQEHGSVIKGVISALKKGSKRASLYSFKGGVQTLVDRLSEHVNARLDEKVMALEFDQNGVTVCTDKDRLHADYVISTLPSYQLAELFKPTDQELANELEQIEYAGLTVVNVGFASHELSHKGFGYLIPSSENERVMGVVFDSQIFPEQSRDKDQLRMTVMIRGDNQTKSDYEKCTLDALRRHLKIEKTPDVIEVMQWKRVIPQFFVGYPDFKKQLLDKVQARYPNFEMLGTFISGVSVDDCIASAKRLQVLNG